MSTTTPLPLSAETTPNHRPAHASLPTEERFRLLVENAQDVLFHHELVPALRPTYISPAIQRMTGYTPQDYYDNPNLALEVVHPDDRHLVQPFLQGAVSLEKTITLRFVHRNGSIVWTEQTAVPIFNDRGNLVAVEGVARDISDRMNYEQQLAAAKEAAEAANKAKDQFLAFLSHELRTPLTPALLAASLLENRTDLPPDLLADIHTIRQGIELQARIIDDLLDLSRIAHGRLHFNFRTCDLHAIIRTSAQTCATGQGAPIRLNLLAPDSFVRGDPARLQQVFWNLLNNARKFTPPDGAITVRTSNTPDNSIQVDLADTGVGIEPQFLPRIFDAFEQGDPSRAKQFGGLGLGLAICKAITDAHAGRLSARSDGKNRGATFSLRLPGPAGRLVCRDPQGGRHASGEQPPRPRGTAGREETAQETGLPDHTPLAGRSTFTERKIELMEVPFVPDTVF